MKKYAALLLLSLIALSCASGGANKDRVKLELVQLTGPSDVQPTGRFDAQFGVGVENPTTETVTLRRIELQQISTGSYQIRRDPISGNEAYTFNQAIAPGQTGNVAFWVHAFQRVLPGSFGASEPVTIRAVVYFESPSGGFHQVVQKTLQQFGQ